MKCSRCGHRRPNEYCYVCREDETPRDTPDENGGSLLRSRHSDLVGIACGLACVASVVTLVILAACGCREFSAYLAASGLGIMAAFIAITNDD